MIKRCLPLTFLAFALAAGCGHKQAKVENPASLDELNRAVLAVSMRSGAFPPPTNEVAQFLALSGKSFPVPPPGKKLVFDPAVRQYVIVDQ